MTHDDHYHADFHQVYNNIIADLYIQNLSQHLKQYITHYLKCLHYQTNSQSECTNQITEIVLQYALKKALNADFTDFLPAFKQIFNNNMNTFTDQTFNEIIYEFNLTDFFDVITDSDAKKFETEHK